MDAHASVTTTRQAATDLTLVSEFARLMRDRYGARLFLFGSRARSTARPDSDYDMVAVAPAFAKQPLLARARDRSELWFAAGGWRKGLDLHCFTPREFREELAGLGYLSHARERGELIEVQPG